MAKKLNVVLSQSREAQPARRALEESLVAELLMGEGFELNLVPHLADLEPDDTGLLCLQGIRDDMAVLSWLAPPAAFAALAQRGIHGRLGRTRWFSEPGNGAAGAMPAGGQRVLYCLDLSAGAQAADFVGELNRIRREHEVSTVPLTGGVLSAVPPPPPMPASPPTTRVPQPDTLPTAAGQAAAAPPPQAADPASPTAAEHGSEDDDDAELDALMDRFDQFEF